MYLHLVLNALSHVQSILQCTRGKKVKLLILDSIYQYCTSS